MKAFWPGTVGACVALLGGCSVFGSVDSPDDTDDDAATPAEPCDVDGVWALSGEAVAYTCCLDEIDIAVNEVTLEEDGAEAYTAPFPTLLAGEPTTCPEGAFDVQGSESGGLCTVEARVMGEFSDADTWEGTFELTFQGCECGGVDPCTDQSFAITGTRVE